MEEFLRMLIYTLNGISVSGKDNLVKLFTCIEESEKMLQEVINGEQGNE